MHDAKGNVNSIVIVMTDITDAAMLQAKLMHTEKMAAVGQLTASIAHEVNNPIAVLQGNLDLMRELLGLTTDHNPYVYLSDGGHYENLGLWEMVARRCRFTDIADVCAAVGATAVQATTSAAAAATSRH